MKPVRLSTQENRNLCCETYPKTFITKSVTGGGYEYYKATALNLQESYVLLHREICIRQCGLVLSFCRAFFQTMRWNALDRV